MNEIWKPVLGSYARHYEVSDQGRVRRTFNLREKTLHVVNGYHYVMLSNGGFRQHASVHRLVAQAFIPPVEGKDCVDHINAVRNDNRAANLRWCSPAENSRFALPQIKATRCRGEANKQAKLTSENVRLIRASWPATKIVDLARDLGVSSTAIVDVLKGRTWAHIDSRAAVVASETYAKHASKRRKPRRKHWARIKPGRIYNQVR